jgi:lipoate-protein ligase A
VDGRKVVGSAQLRQGTAFLQHGSILLEDDQHLLDEIGLGQTGSRLTGSRDRYPLGRSIAFREIAEAIREVWGIAEPPGRRDAETPSSPFPIPDSVLLRHTPRFRSPDWTWER